MNQLKGSCFRQSTSGWGRELPDSVGSVGYSTSPGSCYRLSCSAPQTRLFQPMKEWKHDKYDSQLINQLGNDTHLVATSLRLLLFGFHLKLRLAAV